MWNEKLEICATSTRSRTSTGSVLSTQVPSLAGLVRRAAGCDALVLAGVQTPLCVLATALDAARTPLVPVVAADACAARTAAEHEAALRVLSCGHAHVATIDEIVATFFPEPRP